MGLLFDSVSDLINAMKLAKAENPKKKKKDTTSRDVNRIIDEAIEGAKRTTEDACDRCLRRGIEEITEEMSKAGVGREQPMNMSKIANNPALAFSGDYTYKTEKELQALIDSKKSK